MWREVIQLKRGWEDFFSHEMSRTQIIYKVFDTSSSFTMLSSYTKPENNACVHICAEFSKPRESLVNLPAFGVSSDPLLFCTCNGSGAAIMFWWRCFVFWQYTAHLISRSSTIVSIEVACGHLL